MIIDNDIFNLLGNQPEPKTGDVIIAEPFLVDPYFSRSCILLTKHSDEIDTMGLVVNKKLDYHLTELIPDIETDAEIPVFLGGPLSNDRLFFIHDVSFDIPGATRIAQDVSLGGDFDTVKAILESQPDSSQHFKFFVGYSGWVKGQLSDEITSHTWAVCKNIPLQLIMATNTESTWRDCVASLGSNYKNWLTCPDNPSLN